MTQLLWSLMNYIYHTYMYIIIIKSHYIRNIKKMSQSPYLPQKNPTFPTISLLSKTQLLTPPPSSHQPFLPPPSLSHLNLPTPNLSFRLPTIAHSATVAPVAFVALFA